MIESPVLIGKMAIESLTKSMYKDAECILREYIQNAADQIDVAVRTGLMAKRDAAIHIRLSDDSIIVHDNATGIPKDEVLKKLVNIACSDKDGHTLRGNRGIGRLASLAYCRKLEFITSYAGENVKSIMTWDADKLDELLETPDKQTEAGAVIQKIVSISHEPHDKSDHFFEVKMSQIKPEYKRLLDRDYIEKYLSMVAPLPFAPKFLYKTKIMQFVNENNLRFDDYVIFLDDEQLFKAYGAKIHNDSKGQKETIDQINDIDFQIYRNTDGEILGWSWVAITNFVKQLPPCNLARGLRIRKGNIQVGDSDTLMNFFSEPRANLYFLGEIHAEHRQLIPNTHRDHFNQTSTWHDFGDILRKYFETLSTWFNGASKAKNAYLALHNEQKIIAEFVQKTENKSFSSQEEFDNIKQKIELAKKKTQESAKNLKTYQRKALTVPHLNDILSNIEKKIEKSSPKKKNFLTPEKEQEILSTTKTGFRSQKLVKLSRKEQKLVGRVFSVIDRVLPKDEKLAEELKLKIEEEFK